MIQNNSRGFFDHGFQVEYAVHANEEGKKGYRHIREDGSEYWSARELGPALDYAK